MLEISNVDIQYLSRLIIIEVNRGSSRANVQTALKEKEIIVTIPASGPQEEEVGEGVVPRLQPNGRSKAYLAALKWGPNRRLLRPRGHD